LSEFDKNSSPSNLYSGSGQFATDIVVDRALKEYNLAVGYDPSYPEPHKALGLIYYKQGFRQKSVEEFECYLFLAPDAGDRGYIKQYSDINAVSQTKESGWAPISTEKGQFYNFGVYSLRLSPGFITFTFADVSFSTLMAQACGSCLITSKVS
jgi:tetratricopeptide (TPR) repeat protein